MGKFFDLQILPGERLGTFRDSEYIVHKNVNVNITNIAHLHKRVYIQAEERREKMLTTDFMCIKYRYKRLYMHKL